MEKLCQEKFVFSRFISHLSDSSHIITEIPAVGGRTERSSN